MSQGSESEAAVQKALDTIDAGRRRLTAAGYFAVVGTFAAFFWLSHVARTSGSVTSVVTAAVLALTCVIAWSTFALAIFMTRMTRRVLRAIDLATSRPRQ